MANKKQKLSVEKSKMMFRITQMPKLKHWDGVSEFSYEKSEVCQWLKQQPEFLKWLFEKAKSLGAIEYQGDGWIGVNHPEYKPESPE